MKMSNIVLASTSPYRRELLQKVIPEFAVVAPAVDETQQAGESPQQLVERLAQAKARAVAAQFPQHIIIGSDQVAVVDQSVLGKPGSVERAIAQLQQMRGKTVTFLTGLALYDSALNRSQSLVEPFQVTLRELTDNEIRAYVEREHPLNCAGSFKSEGLGICLFEHLRGDDPNSLIGLPLIQLVRMLARWDYNPLLMDPKTY